jgi:uncharacterized repeat protein (TIGR01451 family)
MSRFTPHSPFFVRAIIALALLAGLGLAAWTLSTPTLNAASRLTPLTFFSPPSGNPQLSLQKTANNNAPAPGDHITYTLSYSNPQAGSQAFNVRLYDFLPAGAQYLSSNPPATLYPNGVLLFTAPSVGPGTQTITATVRIRVPEGHTQMINHALVTADGVTPTVTSLLTNIARPSSAWLHLVKTGPSAVLAERPLVYTLQATNVGTAALYDVTVIDALPTGVTLSSSTPAPSTVTLPTVRWSLGTLNPAETRTIVITATAPTATGIITNSAIGSAWQNVMTQAQLSTIVVIPATILQVTKTGSAPVVRVGETLVYTLSYENTGNVIATNVLLTDTLPAGLTVVGTSQPPITQTAQQLVWNVGTLDPDQQGKIVITATVGGPSNRTLLNIADITGQAGSYSGHAELTTTIPPIQLYLPLIRKN